MGSLAIWSRRHGIGWLSSCYQSGTLTALYSSAWCRTGMPSFTPSELQRNLSSRARARQRGKTRSSPHDRSFRPGLVLSKRRRPTPSSQRGDSSFARVSELRLRNWLKFYNAFRGRKSHIRLSVFMQGTRRCHRRQQHTSGSRDGRTASSSQQHHKAKGVIITGDERRIYWQITSTLEGAMLRVRAQQKENFLKKQRALAKPERNKPISKGDAFKTGIADRNEFVKKGNSSDQPLSKKAFRRNLAMFIPEKQRKQLMAAPEVEAESRDILKLFDKLFLRPNAKVVRDVQTGRRVRKPLISDERAKTIISDLRSSRYMEGALRRSFNDLDVH